MPRSSPREEKLALALQLAGLAQQQQQADTRAGGDQRAQALALIGLMQQQQNASAEHALQEQQVAQMGEYRKGELANQTAQLQQTGEYQKGELAQREAATSAATVNAHGNQLLGLIEAASRNPNVSQNYLTSLMNQTPEGSRASAEAHAAMVPREVAKFQPTFQALHGQLPPGVNVHPDVLAQLQASLPPDVMQASPTSTPGGLTYTGPKLDDVGILGIGKDILSTAGRGAFAPPIGETPDQAALAQQKTREQIKRFFVGKPKS